MLFKLVSCCAIAIISLSPKVSATDVFTDVLDLIGYRGQVLYLDGITLSDAVLRPDGRYLFYSEGGESFSVLDMVNMAQESQEEISTSGSIKSFGLSGNRLSVATTDGIQVFDIQKPLKPEEQTSLAYSRPDDASTTVAWACHGTGESARVAFFETASARENDVVRVVSGTTSQGTTLYSNIFGGYTSDRVPYAFFCTQTAAVIIAKDSDSEVYFGARTSLSGFPGEGFQVATLTPSSLQTGYQLVDLLLNETQDTIFMLYNRTTPLGNNDDSVAVTVSASSLSVQTTKSVGQTGRALASFYDGQTLQCGFFIGKDFSTNDESILKYIAEANLSSGSSSAFSRSATLPDSVTRDRVPSKWLTTKSDHYSYGLLDTGKVILLSKAPQLQFTSVSSTPLTASVPLQFTVTTDRPVTYQIRASDEVDADGSSVGLPTGNGLVANYGKLIRTEGTFDQNSPLSLILTSSELNLQNDGAQSLSIFAWETGTAEPVARLGMRFDYDPPPPPVTGLRLNTGDQSVHVFFNPPHKNDLQYYKVYCSYDSTKLAAGFQADSITLLDGRVYNCPDIVDAATFEERFIISPAENGRELYIRVVVVDDAGQESLSNPDMVSAIPYRTLSLREALGNSDMSCSLQPSSDKALPWTCFLAFFLCLGLCVGLKKNWAQLN